MTETVNSVRTSADISRATQVKGWMNEAELFWLAQQALTRLRIVELGCYLGRSTRALGDNTLGKVLAVDDWMGADAGDYTRPLTPDLSAQMFAEFRANVEDLVDAGIVVPCRANHDDHGSLDLAPDMVFIDGDHSYMGCRRDILAWWPKVVVGGILCGHDAGYGPVSRAVSDSFQKWEVAEGTNIWFVIKTEEAA